MQGRGRVRPVLPEAKAWSRPGGGAGGSWTCPPASKQRLGQQMQTRSGPPGCKEDASKEMCCDVKKRPKPTPRTKIPLPPQEEGSPGCLLRCVVPTSAYHPFLTWGMMMVRWGPDGQYTRRLGNEHCCFFSVQTDTQTHTSLAALRIELTGQGAEVK